MRFEVYENISGINKDTHTLCNKENRIYPVGRVN